MLPGLLGPGLLGPTGPALLILPVKAKCRQSGFTPRRIPTHDLSREFSIACLSTEYIYIHHSEIFSGIPELFESEFRILAFTLLNGVCDREIRKSACGNAPGYGERLISLRIEKVITFYLGVAAV